MRCGLQSRPAVQLADFRGWCPAPSPGWRCTVEWRHPAVPERWQRRHARAAALHGQSGWRCRAVRGGSGRSAPGECGFLHVDVGLQLFAVDHQLAGLTDAGGQRGLCFLKCLLGVGRIEGHQHIAFCTKSVLSAQTFVTLPDTCAIICTWFPAT